MHRLEVHHIHHMLRELNGEDPELGAFRLDVTYDPSAAISESFIARIVGDDSLPIFDRDGDQQLIAKSHLLQGALQRLNELCAIGYEVR